ncbi:MAG: BLUF domain-containing protein [Gemmatimonadales bacterium]
MTTILQLIYASSATEPVAPRDLLGLLHTCRQNNVRVEVTGFLGHNDGTFLQMLEGPEENVRALFTKILRDPRHADATVLVARTADSRFFPEWSMGFQEIDQVIPGPGLSQFLPPAGAVAMWAEHPEAVLAFFELCREPAVVTASSSD